MYISYCIIHPTQQLTPIELVLRYFLSTGFKLINFLKYIVFIYLIYATLVLIFSEWIQMNADGPKDDKRN